MAFNLFGKKKSTPKKTVAAPVEAAEVSAVQSPSIAAPTNNSVLKSFFVSEKSARGQAHNQYTFVVDPSATKSEVKRAVQKAYKVNVTGVNMIRIPSKQRIVGRWRGTKPSLRKAIVTLKDGQVIAQAQP